MATWHNRPALERYLRRALALLRWVTLAVLLPIVVTQPSVGYRRLPMWALVAVFAGYSLVLDGFRWVLLRCLKAVRFERSAASLSCLFQLIVRANLERVRLLVPTIADGL